MKRFYFQLTFALFFLCSFHLNAQDSGLYDGFAITESNGAGNFYHQLVDNAGFDGADLGNFTCTNSLTLKGGQNKVWKCYTDNDITGGDLNYRVYATTGTAPAFSSLNLGFLSDDPNSACGGNGANQVWETNNASIDLLAGLSPGTYFLEVYNTANYTWFGNSGIHYLSNGGTNYKATFTVFDDAPTITCPGNITQNTDASACGAVVTYTVTSADDCGGETISQTAGLASDSTFPVGTTTNTFVVTDDAGNTATCSFNVTVNDTEDPVITCPSDITLSAALGQCYATNISLGEPVNIVNPDFEILYKAGSTTATSPVFGIHQGANGSSENNLTGPNVTFSDGSTGNLFDLPGWTWNTNMGITNENSNFTGNRDMIMWMNGASFGGGTAEKTMSQTLQENLEQNVSYTLTADFGWRNDNGIASAPQVLRLYAGNTLLTPVSSESPDLVQGSFVTHKRTYLINNPSILGTLRIEFGLGANTNGQQLNTDHITLTKNVPIASDNCDVSVMATFNGSPVTAATQFAVGNNTVLWTATDTAGNTATCTQIVTVEDNEAPVISCNTITVQLDAAGNYTLSQAEIDSIGVGSTDNCTGLLTYSVNNDSFDCDNVIPDLFFSEYVEGSGPQKYIEIYNGTGSAVNLSDYQLRLYTDGASSPSQMNTLSGTLTNGATIVYRSFSASIYTGATTPSASVFWNGNDTIELYKISTGVSVDVFGEIGVNPGTQWGTTATNETQNQTLRRNTNIFRGNIGNLPGFPSLQTEWTEFALDDVSGLGSHSLDTGVVLTVTDSNNNSSTCTATIIVEDNIAPTAICQNVTVQLDENGVGSITSEDVDNGSADACGIASLELSQTDFDCSHIGLANEVTLTVTDVNGNVSTCTSTVTVEDTVAPVISCNTITVQLDATGNYSLSQAEIDSIGVGSTDNCNGLLTYSVDNNSFDCDNVLAAPVVVPDLFFSEYVEGSGPQKYIEIYNGTGSAVNLSDYQLRLYTNSVASPSVINTLSGTLNNGATIVYRSTGATIYTGAATPSTSVVWNGDDSVELYKISTGVSIDIFGAIGADPGTQWGTTATNETQNQTLRRNTNIVQGNIDNLSGFPSLQTEWTEFPLDDVSGLGSHSHDTGVTEVLLTVTDSNNNSSSCTATIIVEDNIAPATICQNVTVQLDENGVGSITVEDVDNGSSDACGIDSLVLSQTDFDCSHIGLANEVTLTVTDENGNVSTCTANVTVEDTVDPVVVCNTITVQLDAAGNYTLSQAEIDSIGVGSSDVCGAVTFSVDNNSFDCNNVSTAPVVISDLFFSEYVEGSGPQKYIEIYNGTGSAVNLSDYQLRLYSNGASSPSQNNTLSGTLNNGSTIVYQSNSASIYTGATTSSSSVVWNGNDSIELYKISISSSIDIFGKIGEDPGFQWGTAPTNETQNQTLRRNTSIVQGNIDDASGFPSLQTEWTEFAIDDVSGLGSHSHDTGVTEVLLTVTDSNNNSSSCTATIIVEDNINPTITCPGNITQNNDASICGAVVNYTVSSDDNCTGEIITQTAGIASGEEFPEGTTTNTFVVTDGSGNTATCSFDVTITDNEAPVVSCLNPTVTLDANGNASITIADVYAGATDNCGVDANSVTIDVTSVDCSNLSGDAGDPIWINEFHYDNASTDVGEFIEVAGTAGLDLSTYSIVFYNGSNGATYSSAVNLSGTIPNEGSGFGAVSIAHGLQNGGPDGFALINNGTTVIEFLSYEGTFTATNGPASGMTSTDVGVTEPSNTPIGESIQRIGAGNTAVSFSWTDAVESPGTLNAGQTASNGGATVVVSVTDIHGNVGTCTATVTVEDTINPTITCPGNISQNNDAGICGAVVNYTVISDDNCTGEIITQTAGIASGEEFPEGTTTNTFVVTDSSGNTATCSFDVIITDNEAPVVSCLNPTVTLDANGNASITIADVYAGATDNCGVDANSITIDVTSVDCSNLSGGAGDPIWINEFHYDNASTDVGEFIEIAGTAGLDLSTYSIVFYNGSNGATYSSAVNLSGTIPDEGSGFGAVSIAHGLQNGGPDGFALINNGTTVIEFLSYEGTFTATNGPASGMTSTDVGVTEPSNTPIGESIQRIGAGNTATSFSWTDAAESPGTLNAGQTASNGGATVVVSVTDIHGNVGTCTATVTVEDTINPTITCPGNITQNNDAGICGAVVNYTVSSDDNCTGEIITQTAGIASGEEFPEGTTTNTFVVTDSSGNTATCSFDVTITDNEAPEVSCLNPTVYLDANGNASITIADVYAGATDNCGVDANSVSIDVSTFDCDNLSGSGGDSIWINEFHYDNASTDVNEFIEVAGTAGLDLSSYSIVFYNGINGETYSSAENLSGTIPDEGSGFGAVSIAHGLQNGSPDGFALINNGTTVIEFLSYEGTFTATNGPASGMTSTDVGVTEPSSTPIGESIQRIGAGNTAASFSWTDGLESPGTLNTGQTASSGITSVIVSITDIHGNVGTCTATVTVLDNIVPVITSNGNQNVNTDVDVCGATVIVSATATDNCTVSAPVGVRDDGLLLTNVYPVGTTTITWNITDDNGNAADEVIQTVIVTDNQIPVITSNGNQNVNTDIDVCGATVVVSATATDNCTVSTPVGVRDDGLLLTDVYPVGTTTISWNIADENTNAAIEVIQTVIVTDNQIPVITSNGNQNVNTDLDVCGATVVVSATATDNCTVSTPVGVRDDGLLLTDVYPVGTTTITWNIADENNNAAVPVIQTVTVTDNQIPVITSSGDQDVNTDVDVCGATVIVSATATDNCTVSTPVGVRDDGLLLTDIYPIGTTTITWDIADENVNPADQVIQTVTVTDNQIPVITSNGDQNVNNDVDVCGATVVVSATATDNCTVSTPVGVRDDGLLLTDVYPVGTTTITWNIADENGNPAEPVIQTITVTDNQAPTVNCFSINVILDSAGMGGLSATQIADIEGTVSDNCEIATIDISELNFSCDDIGGDLDNLIISEYVDGSGNDDVIEIYNGTGNTVNLFAGNYSLDIYEDGSPTPTLTTPLLLSIANDDVYVVSNPFSAGAAQADQTGNVGFDGNDAIVLSKDGVPIDIIGQVGVNPGTGWSFGANTTAGTTLVRNIDVLQGNISDVSGIGTEWTQYAQNTVSNLGGHIIEIAELANNVILTVTDIHGNVTTCEGSVFVLDETDPIALCQNVTVQLINGVGVTTAQAVNNNSTDACGIGGLALSQTTFDCSHVGTNTVTLTVTDNNGRTATCTATVTVEDNEAAEVVTQDITIQLNASGTASITAAQIDNGSDDECGIQSISVSPDTFDCSNVGLTNTVTLTVTDTNNNVSTGTATVTVEDNVIPNAVCQNITVTLNALGTVSITGEDVDGGSTDNCGLPLTFEVSQTTFDCSHEGANTVTLTVTDSNGNEDTCTATVTVEGDFPDVTISEGELPDFCQGAVLVLTANSALAVSYDWVDTAASQITIGTDQELQVSGNGTYGVTVTSATNCTAYVEYTVVGFDAGALASSYTILAINEVFLHGSNIVQSGAVGATASNGLIKLHQATTVAGLGQAANFSLNQGSSVGTQVYAPANPTIPPFAFNTQSTTSSPDATINTNQTQTLNGSVYDVVNVKAGGTVIFTQSNVYINELRTAQDVTIEFSSGANVFINDKFTLAKNGTINSLGTHVVMYIDADVQIERGSYVRARMHSNGNELLAKGENANGNNAAEPTFMIGQFICEKVHGNTNVIWNADDLCNPTALPNPQSAVSNVVEETGRESITLDVMAWPNPSNAHFNLKLRSSIGTSKVQIQVFDMNNRLVYSDAFEYDEVYKLRVKLESGVYNVRVTQAGEVESVRLVKY